MRNSVQKKRSLDREEDDQGSDTKRAKPSLIQESEVSADEDAREAQSSRAGVMMPQVLNT